MACTQNGQRHAIVSWFCDVHSISPQTCGLPDFDKPFAVATDASNAGVGGVLYQPSPDGDGAITPDNIVMICSKILNPSQRNYSVYKKELFAIVYCLRKFHSYLYGRHFDLYTDHKPLTYMFVSETLSVPLQQWLDVIVSYSFQIHHRDGILNVLPDALSRVYAGQYEQSTWGIPKHIQVDPTWIEVNAVSTRSSTRVRGGGVEDVRKSKDDISGQCELRGKEAPPVSERIPLMEHHHCNDLLKELRGHVICSQSPLAKSVETKKQYACGWQAG